MKQRPFEKLHAADWQAFAATLDRLEGRAGARTAAALLPVAEIPVTYRRLCQQLAIARAQALLSGRDFITPDDIKTMVKPALRLYGIPAL